MNDWSARDLQFEEMTVRLGPAKGKDGATSLGPYLVTPDELIQGDAGSSPDAPLTARINGEDIGHANLAGMSFTFGQMIAYASRGSIVRAGDIFGSGTCGGGCLAELWGRFGRNHHAPLRPGDVVELDGGPPRTPTVTRRTRRSRNRAKRIPRQDCSRPTQLTR